MINRQALLADLQKFLQRIEADLLERSESTEVPEVPAALHTEYERAAKAERTAQNYEDWRTDTITQAAAAWVLSCVFVRFLEDNSIIDPPKIAGPGERLARARDEHELYFRSHPKHTDREYLLSIFAELAKLPGTKDIFGEHNAINDLPNWLSGDAAGDLLNFFQKIDASTGDLVHDFTDPNWDTRFLGDLYQDLSESARKKFALLQTPDFVEEFILGRTLEPALDVFGLEQDLGSSNHGKLPGFDDRNTLRIPFKMIDPACGSGHFLLGAFRRLLDRWQRKEPGTNIRELTQRALNSIHGVDINPFAVAIAKFRLLLVAMSACDIQRLANAPAFHVNVACGDSLLHGENRTSSGQDLMDFADGATDNELYAHAYPGEDLQTVRSLLMQNAYHCVVANPPYIVPKDSKLNDWYRKRFSACHMKYSLAIPFMQQTFQLAVQGGFTGQITANSFMNREFGKKLIESFLPTVDLTHVVDTSGAYIPGHGTPTVIILGRNRKPTETVIRTVMGIKGEPETPKLASAGKVWSAIVNQIDRCGSKSDYLTVSNSQRCLFEKHPWSISGGGVSELKQRLEDNREYSLGEKTSVLGYFGIPAADEVFLIPSHVSKSLRIEEELIRTLVNGDELTDWSISRSGSTIFPYERNGDLIDLGAYKGFANYAWSFKTVLGNRPTFNKSTYFNEGLPWWKWHQVSPDRLEGDTIAFAEIGTHNRFILDEWKTLFSRSVNILKLRKDAGRDQYLIVLALLNSSVANFWGRTVWQQKGGDQVGDDGARVSRIPWEDRLQRDSSKLQQFPIPKRSDLLTNISAQLHGMFANRVALIDDVRFSPNRVSVKSNETTWRSISYEMIYLQEELDWQSYGLYGITNECLTHGTGVVPLRLGERAFEIVLARKIKNQTVQSNWFERHSSNPITELPPEWPVAYKTLVERRIELIENDSSIQLLEQPECKRRWNTEPWESQLERALREWLLLRLATYFDFDGRMTGNADASKRPVPLGEIRMYSIAQLADAARRDPQFMEVGELYRDDPAFDVQVLVEELLLAESVPHLPILRYKDSGLRKRAEWEKTWDLQRREDAGESVGTIPVPPKYTSADFISTGGARYWSLRGKLDVPKERWISFPHCEGPDGTLVICWAGYNHLQQAQAISAYYVRVQTEFGGSDDPRLIPLLASLIELLPWLKQWHNEPNANFDGLRMGDYFEGFVNEEARNLGKTLAEIKAWVPPKKVAQARAKSKKPAKSE